MRHARFLAIVSLLCGAVTFINPYGSVFHTVIVDGWFNRLVDVETKRDRCLEKLVRNADRQNEFLEDLTSFEEERGELSDELLRLEIEYASDAKPTSTS